MTDNLQERGMQIYVVVVRQSYLTYFICILIGLVLGLVMGPSGSVQARGDIFIRLVQMMVISGGAITYKRDGGYGRSEKDWSSRI